MDLSKEYTQMCEKAKEIQELRKDKWQKDDFTISPTTGQIYLGLDEGLQQSVNTNFMTWLPRQDQLQEILEVNSYRWFKLCWAYVESEPLPLSAEMVALELVMITKFNKTWNGEDWV